MGKETEDEIRKLTSTQVNLETFEKEISYIKKIQEDLTQHVDQMQELTVLSTRIMEECPESKIEQQVNSIHNRFDLATKTMTKHMEKLQKVFQNKDLQKDSISEYEKWLELSRQKLKEYENVTSGLSDTKIANFKLIMADKENGSVLLEKAIETGENIFSEIAPKDRDKMRTEIRTLRDEWENHIDYMNTLNKKFETLLLEKSTLNERFNQIKWWLEKIEQSTNAKVELGSNIAHKKTILISLKTIQQDIESHQTNLRTLLDNSSGEAEEKQNILRTQEKIKAVDIKIKNDIEMGTTYVTEHETYNEAMDKAKDMISTLTIELSVLVDTPFESTDAQKRIESANKLLNKKEDGSKLISSCQSMVKNVLNHTADDGKATISKEIEEVAMLWSKFLKNAETFKEQQEKLSNKFGLFRTDLDAIVQWLREMDSKIKDQPMHSNAETKEKQLEKLLVLQKVIKEKNKDIEIVAQKAAEIEGDSELSIQISQMVHKYELLKKNTKE